MGVYNISNIENPARNAVKDLMLQWDFRGDLIDLDDVQKDKLFLEFLKLEPNYCDDLIPAMVDPEHYVKWLNLIYGYHVNSDFVTEYRNSIYEYLEALIDDLICDIREEIQQDALCFYGDTNDHLRCV